MNYHVSIEMNCNGGRRWRNGVHMNMPDAPTLPDASVNAAAIKVVDMLRSISLVSTNFVSVTVSKVLAHGTARTPADFVTIPLAGTGTVADGAEDISQLPKELCLKLAFIPTSGRNGYMLVRNALPSGWWKNQSGEATVAPAAVNNFAAECLPKFRAVGFPALVLLPKNAGPDTVGRTVTDLTLAGVQGRQETVKRKKKQTNSIAGILAHGAEAVAGILGLRQGLVWLASKNPGAIAEGAGATLGATIASIEEILAAAGAAVL